MAHTEDPPHPQPSPPITPSAEPTADPMPPCAPPGDPTPCCGAQGSGSGMGPYPSPPPPAAPRRLHILFTCRPGPWGCPIPPPREDSSTHNVTTSPRVGPRTPAVSPHPLGGTQRGGGLRFGRGGGESCKPPPCVQPVQPATAPSGPQDGAAQPFVGAGRRATHAQTSPHPKHPWVPPRTGSPPSPTPPLLSPCTPRPRGSQATRAQS